MADVTVRDTPTETLVKEALREFEATDGRGRKIKLVKPPVLAQFRLVKILGETAQNSTYLQMVAPLLFVAAIDGDPVGFPQSERELEALIQRLDEDGLTAVMEGVQANFAAADPEAAATEVKR